MAGKCPSSRLGLRTTGLRWRISAQPVPSWEPPLWFKRSSNAPAVSFTHTADTMVSAGPRVWALGLKLSRRKDAADWFYKSKHCTPIYVFGVYGLPVFTHERSPSDSLTVLCCDEPPAASVNCEGWPGAGNTTNFFGFDRRTVWPTRLSGVFSIFTWHQNTCHSLGFVLRLLHVFATTHNNF